MFVLAHAQGDCHLHWTNKVGSISLRTLDCLQCYYLQTGANRVAIKRNFYAILSSLQSWKHKSIAEALPGLRSTLKFELFQRVRARTPFNSRQSREAKNKENRVSLIIPGGSSEKINSIGMPNSVVHARANQVIGLTQSWMTSDYANFVEVQRSDSLQLYKNVLLCNINNMFGWLMICNPVYKRWVARHTLSS